MKNYAHEMFSFRLPQAAIDSYAATPVPWGYLDAAGNALGEVTFLRTYSRQHPDGSRERWHETCARVINGMYSIQKDWCDSNRLPWDEDKAQLSAQEAYDRLFNLKWSPPGRGLWMMGTELVNLHHNSAALQNCAFISTGEMTYDDPTGPFEFMMEASMLGVGVGFDTRGAEKGFVIQEPVGKPVTYVVPDTREGWVRSVKLKLNSYLLPARTPIAFDYSLIRGEGSPIKTFGGTAAGPGPLRRLHESLDALFAGRGGEVLSSVDIADIGNLVGVCVVSGNVRRSAELLIGQLDDDDFLNLKNRERFPERNSYDPAAPGWGWMSNNSVEATVRTNLSPVIDGIVRNGEPGVVWMDMLRNYGRLKDWQKPNQDRDHRVAGVNPCAEMGLESWEMCTLAEIFIGRNESREDFERSIKFTYLYAKTVTLMPTRWPKTNSIMLRNRRVGASISGWADFMDNYGAETLIEWVDKGYDRVQYYDRVYSEWLCVRESIKTTTVKPSGTVSILAGESPGVHWSVGGEYFLRAIRLGNNDPLLALFTEAGYRVEPAAENPETTSVLYFPVRSDARRSEKDVDLWEKARLACTAQRYWSDNAVSVTLSFRPSEAAVVPSVLDTLKGQLKTVSFMPMDTKAYPQMPYTQISETDFLEASRTHRRVNLSPIYEGTPEGLPEASGEAFCTTDVCEMKIEVSQVKPSPAQGFLKV